jgi:hypothetical protein
MDKTRLKKLAGLTENMSPTLQSIAEEVYTLAESRVADAAANQHGYGFDRNAVASEADKIFLEIKAHIDFKLRNHKF